MTHPDDFNDELRASLTLLAESADRGRPLVFAGRNDELRLLDTASRSVRRGDTGRTVVISGVPGTGKTSLMREYATRLMSEDQEDQDGQGPIIPVPLRYDELDMEPSAIMQAMDRQLVELGASDSWKGMANRLAAKTGWVGNAITAFATKKNVWELRPAAQSPNSIDEAFASYASTRFGVTSSTFVLLVDEAQHLPDTRRTRSHLNALHNGIRGNARVTLACFGLNTTRDRLADLGLSRLAHGHAKTIGPLSNAEAVKVVQETIETCISAHTFDRGSFDSHRRTQWIKTAARTILTHSANHPHHLSNGCESLARILLDRGIDDEPPTNALAAECRACLQDYYTDRLRPWEEHITALAHAFSNEKNGWTPRDAVKDILGAADENGDKVDGDKINSILKSLRLHGYVELRRQAYRTTLPSLASHFAELRRKADPKDNVVGILREAAARHRGRPQQSLPH